MQLADCVRLIKAAHMYKLVRLHQMCEAHLQQSLTMQNIFELIRFSDAEKVPTAKKICLEFAIANNKDFITDSRVESLAIGLFQEIIISKERAFASENWSPERVVVTEESTLRRDFKKIYEDMPLADAVFEVDGQKIKCHRAVLSHVSAKLENVMETAKKEPFKLPEKEWKQFSAEAFHSLLRFMYYYETDIKPLPATQLINFAKDFGVAHLADVCENKIRSGIAKNTVLSIMEVAYHPLMDDKPDLQKELRINCSRFFTENIKEIDLEPLKDMKAEVATDLLLAMQKEIGKTWINESGTKGAGSSGEEKLSARSGHKPENSDAEKHIGSKKSKNSSSTADLPAIEKADSASALKVEVTPPADGEKAAPAATEKVEEPKPAADGEKAAADTKPAEPAAGTADSKDAPKDAAEAKPEPAKDAAATPAAVEPEASTEKDDKKADKSKGKKDKKDKADEPEEVPVVSPRKDDSKDKKKDKEREKAEQKEREKAEKEKEKAEKAEKEKEKEKSKKK